MLRCKAPLLTPSSNINPYKRWFHQTSPTLPQLKTAAPTPADALALPIGRVRLRPVACPDLEVVAPEPQPGLPVAAPAPYRRRSHSGRLNVSCPPRNHAPKTGVGSSRLKALTQGVFRIPRPHPPPGQRTQPAR